MLEAYEMFYKPEAWKDYTVEELEWWVKLLTKRAGMRRNADKEAKDLEDARNYQAMLEAKRQE